MPFQKGRPKTGGRKKGVKNGSTSFVEWCTNNKLDIMACLLDSLKDMPPFQQAEYLIKLLEFYYPKQKMMELTSGESGFKIIVEDYCSK